METDLSSVNLILRREIEALIAAPFLKGFIAACGREPALAAARQVIAGLAEESGRQMAQAVGGHSLAHMARVMSLAARGGALEYEVVEDDGRRLTLKVTRCRYVDMYRKHGLGEFGTLFSCDRDFALTRGFNPEMKFTRTRTIMAGGDYCDLCFQLGPEPESEAI
ncbi:MAG: L-2-amino-thiazoline-4-carboxylic acid hydrolase [Thermodesulfobacteriota bacterium]